MSRHYIPPNSSRDGFNLTCHLLFDGMNVPTDRCCHVINRNTPRRRTGRCSSVIGAAIPAISNIPIFSFMLLKVKRSKRASSVFPSRRRLLATKRPCRISIGPCGGAIHVYVAKHPLVRTQRAYFLIANRGGYDVLGRVLSGGGRKICPTSCV